MRLTWHDGRQVSRLLLLVKIHRLAFGARGQHALGVTAQQHAADVAAGPGLALLGPGAAVVHGGGDGGVAHGDRGEAVNGLGGGGAQIGHELDEFLLGVVAIQLLAGDGAVVLDKRRQLGGAQCFGAGMGGAIGKRILAVEAEWHVAGQLAGVELVVHALLGAIADLAQLPLGDGEQHGDDELAHVPLGGHGIAAKVSDVEDDPVFFAVFQHAQGIADIAAEAVDFGDDKVFDVTQPQPVHERAAAVTFGHGDAAAGVRIGKGQPFTDGQTLEGGVVIDALLLQGERSVLMIGGDAAIDGGEVGLDNGGHTVSCEGQVSGG